MRSEPHRIPLSRELTNVLQSLPKIGEYVFPNARSDKGVSKMAMFSAKETLLRKMNRDRSGKSQWIDPKSSCPITPHGFRAIFRTLGMRAFHATSSRSRWAIRLRIRLSGPIGELTASTDVEQLWRPGPISAVANLVGKLQTASRLGRGLINAQP